MSPIGSVGRSARGRRLPDAIPDSVTNRWRYNEGSGTTVADSEGDLDLSYTGLTWEEDGNFEGGRRADSDGIDDYGETASTTLWTDALTVVFSFRAASDPGDSMFWSKNTEGVALYVRTNDDEFSTPNLSFRVEAAEDKIAISDINPFDGSKHTVGLSIADSDEAVAYYDGSQIGSTSVSSIPEDEGEPMYTRTYSNRVGDFLFEGAVDDLMVAQSKWNDQLHADEHSRRT